jgi:hypothetical protein
MLITLDEKTLELTADKLECEESALFITGLGAGVPPPPPPPPHPNIAVTVHKSISLHTCSETLARVELEKIITCIQNAYCGDCLQA